MAATRELQLSREEFCDGRLDKMDSIETAGDWGVPMLTGFGHLVFEDPFILGERTGHPGGRRHIYMVLKK